MLRYLLRRRHHVVYYNTFFGFPGRTWSKWPQLV